MTTQDRKDTAKLLRSLRPRTHWIYLNGDEKAADRILAHAAVYVLNNEFVTLGQMKRLLESTKKP